MITPTGSTPQPRPAAPSARPEVEALLSKGTYGPARQKLATLLATYPEETLREAKEFGLQIGTAVHQNQLMVGFGEWAKGLYLPAEKRVVLDEKILMSAEGDALVFHEMTHALDAIRGVERHPIRRQKPLFLGPPAADSVTDARLGRLYGEYRARNRVEEAVEFRDRLALRYPEGIPAKVTDGDVTYERKGSTERVRFAEPTRLIPGQVGRLLAAGAVVALGVALAAPLMGAAGVALGALAALDGRGRQRVPDQEGNAEAVVTRGFRSTEVRLPEGYGTAPDTSWSDYAHRTNLVQEYLAEGMAALRQESPERREAMLVHDPKFARYLQQRLEQENG